MTFPEQFEGPANTLFLRDRKILRILTLPGEEVVLPLADFLSFLLHLTLHHAGALSIVDRAERLANLLRERKSSYDA